MKFVRRSLAVLLAVLLIAPAVQAQSHVIGKAALDKAVQERVNQEQADRDAIRSLLQRDDVRDVARVMESEQIRRMPIVDRNKRLVGIVALAVIIFEGGLGTRVADLRPVMWSALSLSISFACEAISAS